MTALNNLYVKELLVKTDIKFSGIGETVKTHLESDSKHRVINDLGDSLTELWSSTKIVTDLGLKLDASNFNVPFGYAALDASGLLPNILVPPITLTKPIVYADLVERDNDVGNVEPGDVAIVIGVGKTYMYAGIGMGYVELISTGSIATINGKSGGSVMLYTNDIPEHIDLYYTEARVSANIDLVSNTNRILSIEPWYESTSSEVCTEVFPSNITEIASASQNTSFTPIAGTYRVTFNAQFELTKGGTVVSRCPAAITNLIDQLDLLTYTAHAAGYGAGEVLLPGNYYIAGATTHTGILEFDAKGNPNATFVISGGAAHAIEIGASTVLSNGAQACNIIYHIVGALSAGAGVTIIGTFVGEAAVGIGVDCILDGRLFTTNGAITTSDVMALPTSDTFAFDLGVASQFVLFSILGNITNPVPGTHPSIINSGIVACGDGTVLGFPPYDGIYVTDPDTTPALRIMFGIYNGETISPSSLTYVENTVPGKYYSVSIATSIISTGDPISARIGVDSDKGSAIVTNRTLFARKLT
jgi:hypothetical protein